MFSKLFEILRDAEHLLSLEPEELAGPLLVSLIDNLKNNGENDKTFSPDIIGYDNMKREIDGSSHRIPNLNYPYGCCDDVLFALMEAWQYLFSEGYIALAPKNLTGISHAGTIPKYFVTRRGRKIENLDDYEAYRKADLLRKHQLHPIIAEKVWFIFAQGSYGTAVLEAFKQVEIVVREAGYYAENDRGTDLMRKAFNVNNGNLTDQSQLPAVKQAMSDLFAGAIGLYKNPNSHHEVEFAPEEAAEIIIIASHLLRIVDSCNQADGDWQEQFANRFVRHLKDRESPLMDPEAFMGEGARGYPRYIGFNIRKIENLDIADRNAFWLVASTIHDGKIYLKLHMNDSNYFSRLELQKASIQREFGEQLKWEHESKPHRIGVDLPVNPLDKNRGQWNHHFKDMCEKLEKLNEIFQSRIEALFFEDDIPF